MADTHKKMEAGAPEPEEVTEVTQAAAPAEDEPDAAGATKVLGPARRPSRTRRILVGLLVLLCCLAVVVSGVTIWVHYTVMNTNGYMNLVGPIGKDPQAIAALSSYIAGQAVTATDLQQRVTDALPAKAQLSRS